ncbi:ribosomal protein-like protein [Thalictrum thalictroides]|uniref:Ribosomal protein-like protein n=1 Tax=Thalictrum thalictroides TaxID=46969 RepID=A0A7J6UZ87_THATH|nr:ribosomal protein-like protein [Thalictrum thalictroides]
MEPTTQKKKLPQIPTPQELLSRFEFQGMETNEALMKVIEDLQNVLVRVVSSGRGMETNEALMKVIEDLQNVLVRVVSSGRGMETNEALMKVIEDLQNVLVRVVSSGRGMETNEALMKVIEDLQNVLVRVVSSGRGKKDKFMVESSRKLETVHTRLAILELKLDSKPGYGESLAIGVVAGTLVKGCCSSCFWSNWANVECC